jgi:hypothetical protein
MEPTPNQVRQAWLACKHKYRAGISNETLDGVAKFVRFMKQGTPKFYKPTIVQANNAQIKSEKYPTWGINTRCVIVIDKEKYPVFPGTFSKREPPHWWGYPFNMKSHNEIWQDVEDRDRFTTMIFSGNFENAFKIRLAYDQNLAKYAEKVDSIVEEYLNKQKSGESTALKSRFEKKWMKVLKNEDVQNMFNLPKEDFAEWFIKMAKDEHFRNAFHRFSDILRNLDDINRNQILSMDKDAMIWMFTKILKNPNGFYNMSYFIERNKQDFEVVKSEEIDTLYDIAIAESIVKA